MYYVLRSVCEYVSGGRGGGGRGIYLDLTWMIQSEDLLKSSRGPFPGDSRRICKISSRVVPAVSQRRISISHHQTPRIHRENYHRYKETCRCLSGYWACVCECECVGVCVGVYVGYCVK